MAVCSFKFMQKTALCDLPSNLPSNLPTILIPILDRDSELQSALSDVAGLILIRREVLMADKAGFDHICVFSQSENNAVSDALAGTCARVTGVEWLLELQQRQNPLLLLAPDCLPDRSFFRQVVEQQIRPDELILWQGEQAMLLEADSYPALPEGVTQAHSFTALIDHLSQSNTSGSVKHIHAPVGQCIRNRDDCLQAENILLSGLVKATEGWMALHINRKVSLAVTRRLMRTAVTPNHMTGVSMLLGLMGAGCFTYPAHGMQILGALLFLSHSILDGCDGELARLKFMESRLGGVLDFWSDNIVHIAVFAAMGAAWIAVSPDSIWPWLCAALAVTGTATSAALVYVHTMHTEKKAGPLYTSVSTSQRKSAMVRLADLLSRRDFIYLVLLLAMLNHTHWFLIMTAIGAPIYALLLIGIIWRDPSQKTEKH